MEAIGLIDEFNAACKQLDLSSDQRRHAERQLLNRLLRLCNAHCPASARECIGEEVAEACELDRVDDIAFYGRLSPGIQLGIKRYFETHPRCSCGAELAERNGESCKECECAS